MVWSRNGLRLKNLKTILTYVGTETSQPSLAPLRALLGTRKRHVALLRQPLIPLRSSHSRKSTFFPLLPSMIDDLYVPWFEEYELCASCCFLVYRLGVVAVAPQGVYLGFSQFRRCRRRSLAAYQRRRFFCLMVLGSRLVGADQVLIYFLVSCVTVVTLCKQNDLGTQQSVVKVKTGCVRELIFGTFYFYL